MHVLPADWTSLVAVVLLLGLKHGFDADHLAAIDGLTRISRRAQARHARYCGALFSLGHGLVVILNRAAGELGLGALARAGLARAGPCLDLDLLPDTARRLEPARGAERAAARGGRAGWLAQPLGWPRPARGSCSRSVRCSPCPSIR